MAVEAGARAALIRPDATTFAYIRQHAVDLDEAAFAQAQQDWQTLYSEPDAQFEVDHHFNATDVAPYITWGTSPDQAIPIDGYIPDTAHNDNKALHYMGLSAGASLLGMPIERVFIGSCTNGRIEDLRSAASIIAGGHVAQGVRAMVVPGSGSVRRQAEQEGLADIFINAGFEWRQPGCSMCLAMNDDVLTPGERCASTTNRNFEGRQGREGRTHLMSPAMAAAAAIRGCISDVRELDKELAHV